MRKGESMPPEVRAKISATRKQQLADPKARQRISEGRRAGERRRLEQGGAEVTEKRCPRCKEVKPVTDFTTRREKLKCGLTIARPDSWCRVCNREGTRARVQRALERGENPYRDQWRKRKAARTKQQRERERERNREAQAARRRRNGAKAVGPRKATRERLARSERQRKVETTPIATFLRERIGAEGVAMIAERTGLDARALYRIAHEEHPTIALRLVDEVLAGLDAVERLAELYPLPEEESQGWHVFDEQGRMLW